MSDLKIEKPDVPAYSKFLSENPLDNPYSLVPLLGAYRDAFACDFELLFITRNETPIASCALFVGKRFNQPIVRLMPVRSYDGVNFRKLEGSNNQKQEYEKLLSLQLLEEYLEKNFSFHQMAFPPGFMDIRSFQWAGATVIPRYTYIMDLNEFSEENYTWGLKKKLRMARDASLTFGTCGVEQLTELQDLSYKRHGRRSPVSRDMISRVLSNLNSAGMIELYCVKNKDGRVLAAVGLLVTKEASYFYVVGTNTEGERGASALLYHEILNVGKQAGKSFVDFCGANTPTINLFKSAFGPRLQVYFRVWRANRFMARLASMVKKI